MEAPENDNGDENWGLNVDPGTLASPSEDQMLNPQFHDADDDDDDDGMLEADEED
jgi:hypothetical protein